MAMRIKRVEPLTSGVISDLQDLLDDLKNIAANNYITLAKRALLHLTWMCDNNDMLKCELRVCEGLETVAHFWLNCQHPELTGLAAFCLASAVSNNVESQKELCNEAVFQKLCKTLSSASALPKTKLTIASLIIALVSQNEYQQSGLRDSAAEDGIQWLNNVVMNVESSKELWSSVVTAICASINNPQNEENQGLATRVLPQALHFLDGCVDVETVRRLTLLITYMLTNNVITKRFTFGIRGLKRLMSSLTAVINMDVEQRLELAVYHICVINVYIDDNEEGVQLCGELNIIPLILNLLSEASLQLSDTLQIVITLSHCISSNKMNLQKLIDCNGIAVLARLISQTNDEQLSSIIKYLLHICVNLEGSQNKMISDRNSDIQNSFLSRLASLWEKCVSTKSNSDQTVVLPDTVRSPSKQPSSVAPNISECVLVRSANSVVSKPVSVECSTEPRVTSKPAVSLRRQLDTNITNTEPNRFIPRKLEVPINSVTSSQVTPCQSTEYLARCHRNLAPSSGKRVVVRFTHNGDKITELEKLPAARSTVVSNLEPSDNGTFKRPANAPLKVKRTDIRSPKLLMLTEKGERVVQPQLHCSSGRMVPSCALSDKMKLDDRVRSCDRVKNTGVPVNSKYCRSLQESATSPPNYASPLFNSPDNGTASLHKVQSWLVSTSNYFPLSDTDVCTTAGEQEFKDKFDVSTEQVKKGLRESVANVSRFRTSTNSACPGCQSQAEPGSVVLNSQTYNIAIETSSFTCVKHRAMRQAERSIAAQIRTKMGTCRRLLRERLINKNVITASCHRSPSRRELTYEFEPYDEANVNDTDCGLDEKKLSPPSESTESDLASDQRSAQDCHNMSQTSRDTRRRRIPYSQHEIDNLRKGVAMHGKFWTRILHSYKFRPCRTAVDLKDKYRKMMKDPVQMKATPSCSSPLPSSRRLNLKPFSMAEERRLKRGFRMFGYNWKAILASMQFAENRTAQELRNKWRTMHKI